MKADNLVELTNSMVCYGVSLCVFVTLNLYKHYNTEQYALQVPPHIKSQQLRQAAETCWAYVISWTSTCLLVPIFSHLIFAEVYALKGGVADSTVTVIGLTWGFFLAMIVWIYIQWIARFRSKVLISVFFLAMFGVYIAQVFFTFASLHTTEPGHFVVFLFIIPIVTSIDATRRSNNYRDTVDNMVRAPSARKAVANTLANNAHVFTVPTGEDSDSDK
jgi:hypothetical protein